MDTWTRPQLRLGWSDMGLESIEYLVHEPLFGCSLLAALLLALSEFLKIAINLVLIEGDH